MLVVGEAAVLGVSFGADGFLYKNGVLARRADARRLNGGFVDVDGFLEHCGSAVVVAVDNGLVYADGFFERRRGWSPVGSVDGALVYADGFLDGWGGAAGGGVNGGLFYTDGLLEGRTVVVVVMGGGMAAVYNGLGDVHVLAVAWLVASTVFTLDLVDGAEVLVVLVVVPVVRRVVVVVSVSVDFNVRINVR